MLQPVLGSTSRILRISHVTTKAYAAMLVDLYLFAIYLGSSRASLSSLLVPRRSDFVALRRIAASIVA